MWAIGYQQCRYSYYPDTRVKNIVDSLRQERFPADVVWMDIDYMDSFKVFTFNPETFPDPQGLADHIHARDMKAVYMIDPGIKVEPGYFVYDQGHANDYFVKKPDGTEFTGSVWPGPCNFPDYTRHEVRSWWSWLTKEFMLKGADGLWNDMNEPSVFDGVDGTMDEDAKDGFEYRKGQFAEYAFTASTDAKGVLTVTMKQTGGKADYGRKTLRIAYVYDGKIAYSPWTKGESVSMKTPKEKEFSLARSVR